MRIRELREAKGLRVGELAAQCGVTAAAVCQWEANENIPKADKLPTIAAVLGVEVGELYDARELKAASDAAVSRIREAARTSAAKLREEADACRA